MENKEPVIGIICSSFDLLHAGHVHILEEAKGHCDILIAALNINPNAGNPNKHKPIQSVFERWTQLEAIKYVDKIIPYEDDADLDLLLKMITHHVRFLGGDYNVPGKTYVGQAYEQSKGIKPIYIARDHDLSTSELRARVCKLENEAVGG